MSFLKLLFTVKLDVPLLHRTTDDSSDIPEAHPAAAVIFLTTSM